MTSEDDGWFGGKISTELYERCKKWIAENKGMGYLGHGTADRHEAMMERCTMIVEDYEGGVR